MFRKTIVTILFLLCGLWFIGNGSYIHAKAILAQLLLEAAWTETLNGQKEVKPWPWADTWPVARLSAKGGDIELIILEGGSGRTLAFGPGHLSISALPGQNGNSIIAGHRDTHFQFLQHMKVGEKITVDLPDGRRHLYQVTDIDVVDSRRGSLILDTDAPTMSLVTCYPFGAMDAGGPMRYVVSTELLI